MGESADFQKGITAYERGDFATALREWKPVAEQGDASAQFNLGWMYRKGLGVPQDYKTAVKWYRLAADQGYDGAQLSLGIMYSEGRGVLQDFVLAHMWLNIAAAQGNEDARDLRNATGEKMTAAQIAKAQEMARQWIATETKNNPTGAITQGQSKVSNTKQSSMDKLTNLASLVSPKVAALLMFLEQLPSDNTSSSVLGSSKTTAVVLPSDATMLA
jgi:TPR repeat protein